MSRYWLFTTIKLLCFVLFLFNLSSVLLSVADAAQGHFAVSTCVFTQLASQRTPFAILHRHLQYGGGLTCIEHESPISLYNERMLFVPPYHSSFIRTFKLCRSLASVHFPRMTKQAASSAVFRLSPFVMRHDYPHKPPSAACL